MNKSNEPRDQTIKIVAVGDICLGDHYFTLGHGVGSICEKKGLRYVIGEAGDLLRDADIVFGNLECVLSNTSAQTAVIEKSVFRGNPGLARDLKDQGFNAISIANNHILQHGLEGAKETILALQEADIEPIGRLDQKTGKSRPIIKTLESSAIAFLGYSLIKENYYPDNGLYAQKTINDICDEINEIAKVVKLVIVSVHDGDEGLPIPSPLARENAKRIIEAGADIYLGHHSHTFQGVEYYNGGLIFYSLGNFIFDLLWDRAFVTSNIAKILVNPKTRAIQYQLSPILLSDSYRLLTSNNGNQKTFSCPIVPCDSDYSWLDDTIYSRMMQDRELEMRKKKLAYFMRNLVRGKSTAKLAFLIHKLFKFILMGG